VVLLKETITPLMVTGGTIIFISTLMVTVFENDLVNLLSGRKNVIKNQGC
jgi:drug/metabolite transporter (DMT)-like permease